MDGCFRRLTPERLGADPKWKEDIRIQSDVRWLKIPEVNANTDFETMVTISALVFLGIVDVKHQCRAATEEDLLRVETELPIKEPTGFMFKKSESLRTPSRSVRSLNHHFRTRTRTRLPRSISTSGWKDGAEE